jgi:hypothetical protein
MTHMKQTIHPMQNGRGIQFTTSNNYVVSIGFGIGHYCDNYNGGIDGSETVPTSTMEVAIMDASGEFVCLPYDVASYVPVSVMGDIILAVECNDWARVCFLCKQSDEDESKFPKKKTLPLLKKGEKIVTDTNGRDWIVNENL